MIYYGICYKRKYKQTYLNQLQILHLLYRILIIGGSVSGKTYPLIYHIQKVHDDGYSIVDKINLYVKNSNEVNNI